MVMAYAVFEPFGPEIICFNFSFGRGPRP